VSNILLSRENWLDAATLTTDSEVQGLGVANLANSIVQTVWRTGGTTAAYMRADFGAARNVGVLALVQPRTGLLMAETGDTIRHRLDVMIPGAGALLDTGLADSGILAGYGCHVHVPAAAIDARYWQMDASALSLSAHNYVQFGRAWAGPAFRPAHNFAYGWARAWADDGAVSSARKSGADYVDRGARYRIWEFELGWLNDAEAAEIEELLRIAGTTRQVLCVLNPDAMPLGRQVVIGRLEQLTPLMQPAHALHSARFRLRESV
jgi:hypothetical protein